MKKLAICVPNYNRPDYLNKLLTECIESINNSSYKNDIEICVSDDCSEEDITEYMNEIIGDNQDIQITFRKNHTNLGMGMNFASSVEMCDSEYCLLMGSDDSFYNQDSLDRIIKALYDTSADILLFPYFLYNHSIFEPRYMYPLSEDLESRFFDFSVKSDCDFWFDKKHRPEYFIFLSNVVFKKVNWVKSLKNHKWSAKNIYFQACNHLQTLFARGGGYLFYLNEPLVKRNWSFDPHFHFNPRFTYKFFCDFHDLATCFFSGEHKEWAIDNWLSVSDYFAALFSTELNDSEKSHLRSLASNRIKRFERRFMITDLQNFISESSFSSLSKKTILLFGCGKFGEQYKLMCEAHNCTPYAYVDNDKPKHGKIINGLEVISFEKSLEIPNSVYIISVATISDIFEEIYEQLLSAGVSIKDVFIIR